MKTFTKKIYDVHAYKATLKDQDFRRLSKFIHSEYGIQMPLSKKIMLESRLQKRLHSVGMHSFKEYCDYVFSPAGIENEMIHMIDVITTNKTDFFREPNHFDYLTHTLLPELVAAKRTDMQNTITLWSAGCSTGEEPYTLAMVLSDYAEKYAGSNFDFFILATDISTRVLEKAKIGIYNHNDIEPVPLELKKKYILRSKERTKDLVRIVPELRAKVKFRRLNFLAGDFGMHEQMDIIFCRNVIIYFDRPTQEKLLNRFCRYLRPGGHILMGHSETLNGMNIPLVQVVPTIYSKPK